MVILQFIVMTLIILFFFGYGYHIGYMNGKIKQSKKDSVDKKEKI